MDRVNKVYKVNKDKVAKMDKVDKVNKVFKVDKDKMEKVD